ncbi:uncharacterized protein LOC115214431 [Octopus sinensis]|uniref:Uncharacterized protein LOC115214431 n=1 Tax=Octopus sinensis TaxID=2607531 RepID=A0A6P7SM36_9MOLL|nr:uncharacterized protein LOC115214431 [Octopus sinensis]
MDKIWHILPHMLALLTDDSLSSSRVQMWVAHFRRQMESLEDNAMVGRPATATTEEDIGRVVHIVLVERRLTIKQIVNAISISREKIWNILHHSLGMAKVFYLLGATSSDTSQKNTILITSEESLTLLEADPAGFSECYDGRVPVPAVGTLPPHLAQRR